MNLPTSGGRVPPGPKEPAELQIDPATLAFLQGLQATYGPISAVTKTNGRLAYFINDADEVRNLLVRRHASYRKGPGFERVKMLLGNGLIVSDGPTWRRARRMIQPAFTRQNIHRLITLMADCTARRGDRWCDVAEAGGVLDITREMSDFALELILRCIFGGDYEARIMRSGENPFAFLSEESERNLRIVMQVRECRDLVLDVIRERRAGNRDAPFDFLAMYLGATDKDGQGFSDEELLDELVTLIVAGYETSAGTLNWAWYLLAGHDDAERRLLDEARATAAGATAIDHESLAGMTYAQQFLEETLRLYPPVWLFTRRADVDDALAEFDVPEGTDIYLSPYLLHRNERYWPDPERFDPDRFAETGTYRKGERPYFPFSLGPRRCLGEYFSFLEMKVHLGMLVPRFRMEAVDDEAPGLDLGINLRTARSIMLRPSLREGSTN